MKVPTRTTKNTRSQRTERGIDEYALYLRSPSSGWAGGVRVTEPGRLGLLRFFEEGRLLLDQVGGPHLQRPTRTDR